ncbi:MAG TPA: hypothetical protein VMI52_00530 [Acetobacteraceae bacterium]|nr:hypothetical protein [Acetobacteraceae bacterium]
MKGLSRRALRDVDADIDLSEENLPDKRQQDIAALMTVDEALMATLQEVFAGTQLLSDQRKVKLLLKLRTHITVAWNQTRDAFIEIGRALNEVERELDPIERDRLKQGFRRLFPFSDTVASQFRAIARAIDDGHLQRELVPGSYGAAYQMALLTPWQREVAEKRGLMRPDVSRDKLIEFRKEVNADKSPAQGGLVPARMRAELQRLERLRRKSLQELWGMRRRINEIKLLLQEEDG